MKNTVAVIWLVLLAVVTLFIGACTKINDDSYEVKKTVSVGESIDYKLPLAKIGSSPVLFEEFQGKPVFINYWASWCTPCIAEMPSIYEMAKKNPQLVVIGVNMDDDAEKGLRFIEHKVGKAPFDMYVGLNKPIGKIFGMAGIPFSVLISKEGKVLYAEGGERDWMDAESDKIIKQAL